MKTRKDTSLFNAYRTFKADDPGRILLFEPDTGRPDTYFVFDADIAALEAAGVVIPITDRARGTAAEVASIPADCLDAVLAAVVATGGRAAVIRRVFDAESVRSEVRRVVTPGDLVESAT